MQYRENSEIIRPYLRDPTQKSGHASRWQVSFTCVVMGVAWSTRISTIWRKCKLEYNILVEKHEKTHGFRFCELLSSWVLVGLFNTSTEQWFFYRSARPRLSFYHSRNTTPCAPLGFVIRLRRSRAQIIHTNIRASENDSEVVRHVLTWS